MIDKPEIQFFGEGDNVLLLHVLDYSYPNSNSLWDSSWIQVKSRISVGVFSAEILGEIRIDELQNFTNSLDTLYQQLSGTAEFKTMDHWLTILIKVEKLGQITITGSIRDSSDLLNENVLNYTLKTNQTYLQSTLRQLRYVIKQFPLKKNTD